MFPRRKRLPRADFSSALKSSRRLSSANFSAILPKDTRGYAVVVPKKTARLSSARHRIKRRVLAALRALPSLPPSAILFPRASVLDMRYDALQQELIKLFS
ncbi:MAG: ribonuclease P protein component [bacterium]|nr:ribonuclease P protein component [bacterium]